MNNPKSFTTGIEWFDPEICLPSKSGYVLAIHYSVDVNMYNSEGKYFKVGERNVHYDEIKYWAYLPEMPEVE